jgi:hypothetical protein
VLETPGDPRIEELWAKQQIRELAYRYAAAVDTRDWPALESLWVNVPEPLPPPFLNIHSARRLRDAFATTKTTTLFVCNHLIYLDGPDRAHGSVYSIVGVDRGKFFDQAVIYQDSYERHEGKWLFLQREHLLWWGQERLTNPMDLPPANWPSAQVGAGIAFDRIRRT